MFCQSRIAKSPMVRRFASQPPKAPKGGNWNSPSKLTAPPTKKNYWPAIIGFGTSLFIPAYLLWEYKEIRDHTFPEKLTKWLDSRASAELAKTKSLSTGVGQAAEVLSHNVLSKAKEQQQGDDPAAAVVIVEEEVLANDATVTKTTTKTIVDDKGEETTTITTTTVDPATAAATTSTATIVENDAETLSTTTTAISPHPLSSSSSSSSSASSSSDEPSIMKEEIAQIESLLDKYEQSILENVKALDEAAARLKTEANAEIGEAMKEMKAEGHDHLQKLDEVGTEAQKHLGEFKEEATKDLDEVKAHVMKTIMEQQGQLTSLKEVVQKEVVASGEELESKIYDVQAEVKKYLNELLKQRAHAEEVRAEFATLLKQATTRTKEEFDHTLRAQGEAIQQKMQDSVNNMIQDALTKQDELMAEALAFELEKRTRIIEEVVRTHYETQLQEQLDALRLETSAFEHVCAEHSHIQSNNKKLIKLSHALIAVNEAANSSAPFDPAWKELREAANNDEVILLAVEMVPEELPTTGAPTLPSLQKGFRKVERAGCVASFLPPNPSIYGHLLAQVFGFLTIRERELVSGEDDHACLSRAGYYLKKGDLAQAVAQLDQLTPQVKEVCADWYRDARERLLLDQSLDLIRSRLRDLQETLP